MLLAGCVAFAAIFVPRGARAEACRFGYPVGPDPNDPTPFYDGHPVKGTNLYDQFGYHLGGDYWSGFGCTDLGAPVYAVADGTIVEIVDNLGSYLDVLVIRHDVPNVGNVYSMYGHIARDDGLSEGQAVSFRQQIGVIDDVTAYFTPCHVHFELLNETAYQQGPFCTGCENAGFHVSPGYDKKQGVTDGANQAGDPYIEVNDAIDGNWWYYTDEFIDARLDAVCEVCGNGTCEGAETPASCPQDCPVCPAIPPGGATLDEAGPCFEAFGTPQYWTVEQGVGYQGALRYTYTTDAPAVDNYGVWNLTFDQAGSYRLRIYSEPGYGMSTMAAYQVTHAGTTDVVVVDQTQGPMIDLGVFDFASGGGQAVRLDDNTGEPYADMVRIVYDALFVEPLDPGPATGGMTGGGGTTGPPGGTGGSGGTGGPGGTGPWATTGGGSGAPQATTAALPPGYGGGDRGCGCTARTAGALWGLLAPFLRVRRRRPAGGR